MKNPLHRNKSKRKIPSREVKEVILIVYEGKSTEYNYIWSIKKEYRHSNVLLKGPYPDPKTQILETQKILRQNMGINKVYCLFDHDGRKSFQIALELIAKHNKKHGIKIQPITSNPCFEIWPFLHFTYSTKGFQSDSLIKALQKHLPKYRKNLPTIYEELKKKTPQAIKNAEKLSIHQGHDCSKNPYTEVHQLVKVLLSLK